MVPRCQAECLPGCHAPGPAGELQSAAPQPQPCSCKIAGNDTAALVQHSSVMSHSATGHRVCTQAALADSSQLHLPCLKDAAEQGGSSSALQPGLGPTRPGGLTGLASCCRHLSRPLPQAFRVACHFGDSEQEVHDSLRISSSAVFNGVLMFALKEVSPPA